MENKELINLLKYRADTFEKEEIIDIIETAGKAYINNNPFINEEELAEESLNNLLKTLSTYNKQIIQKAKEKIVRIIT
jgi:hypothetical protein